MKKHFAAILLVVLLALLALQACSPSNGGTPTAAPAATAADNTATAAPTATEAPAATQPPTATPAAASSELVLTLDELAQYNGKNGQPAYIAVDGVIYDVTNVPQWKNGDHNGFTAGNDLTVQIKTISPHGVSKLVGVPIVGKLAD